MIHYFENNCSPDINFPVLSVRNNLVGSIDSLDEITRCSKLGLKKGFYKGLLLVDSEGRKFEVVGARKLRSLPPKPAFGSILGFITGNPRLQVELLFAPGPPTPVSFKEVKKIIFDSFSKEARSWEAMIDFDEFRDKVASADSLKELFAIFKEYRV